MELNVVVLDDECIICDGLCAFPWKDYGCKVVGKAEDGDAGWELVQKCRPDIILSDIKMPEMDGLELSARVKELYPETQIILLTGYDDFEFAQQALRIGVVEYLLKPINFKELHAVVEKVCGNIRKRQKQKEDYMLLKEQYRKARPQLVSKAVADVLFGRFKDKNDMTERLKSLKIRLDGSLVVYGTLTEDAEQQEEKLESGLLDFAVCNICEEIFRKNREDIRVFSLTDTMGYCFVLSYPSYQAEQDCMNHCAAACEDAKVQVKEITGRDLSFGISNRSKDACELNLAYKEAVEACEESRFLDENGTVVKYSEISYAGRDSWNITDGEKKRIISEIARGNSETAIRFTDSIFEKCEDIDVMRYAAMELLLQCSLYLNTDKSTWSYEKKAENNAVFLEATDQIFNSRSRKELMYALHKALLWGGSQHLDMHMSRNQRLGKEIEAYIQDNYVRDLSLDDLSEYFKISKAYVNRLLKNLTGKSFLETLTDIRMSKAKALILESNYKVGEVAEMVGYHDFSYFARVFKKKYGTTPNNYKKA